MSDLTIQPQDLGIGRLFERVREAVIVADAKTQRIVLWNSAATNMFGYSISEALRLRVEALVPDRLKDQHKAGIARDFGRFVSGAQNTVEEFKGELLSQEEVKEARRTLGGVKSEITTSVEEFKDEARHSIEELKPEVSPNEKGDELVSDSPRRGRATAAKGQEEATSQ